MSLFGKPKFGGNKRNWFKLKDGDSVYRILPPMGDLREDGRWSVFCGIHYGYKNSKGEMRPFQSPLLKNRKTKMVEVPDAALERITDLKAKLEDAKKAKNEELVAQLLKLVGGKKSRFNLDNNHYMNVVDLQGNIGILKIRHKCKLALDAVIKKLRDSGVEPLDPETGRFFVFSRSGMAMDTVYQVSVYKKTLQVDGVGEVQQDLVHTITDELAKRCLVENKDGSYSYKEAGRLDTLFKKPTAEEVERIVKEGEKAVDEILDSKAETASNTNEYAGEDDSGTEDDDSPVQAQPVQTAQVTKVAETEVVATTQVATKDITPVKAVSAPKTTAESVSEQTDEDFLKSLGL